MLQIILSTYHRFQSATQKHTDFVAYRLLALTLLLFTGLIFTGLLAACQPIQPIRPMPDQTSGATSNDAAIDLVQRYLAALNGVVKEPTKIDEVMSFLAPNAIFINPTGSYLTLDEIRTSLVDGAAQGIFFEATNFRQSDGRVVYDYQVKMGDNLLDEGTDGLDIVKDGKIIFDGTERTEPQKAGTIKAIAV